ncbi:CHAT domain-containing protein [Microcoleus vaginatus]|uniref:CHAT domain-containing protein n=1 Tax=Microcoleus vaginatus TaxID=119532 RepID=UPI001F611861|nr:CHAT domain-containing protein [Microcoleus vaginatus HSN003]
MSEPTSKTFNISGNTINNLAGDNIYYNEAPQIQSNLISEDAVKTILFLAANPQGMQPRSLEEEAREISEGLRRSQHRDRFILKQCWAVRHRDMHRALLDYQPHIVHFAGQGSSEEGLFLEDDTGRSKPVSPEAIANLFQLFPKIECVVLNACYSAVQAKAIADYIPYVIGMQQAIGNKAAIEFAVAFYDALETGKPIEFAYKLGCVAIQMAGISQHSIPVLIH